MKKGVKNTMTTKKKSTRSAETNKKKAGKASATATEVRKTEPTVTVTMMSDAASAPEAPVGETMAPPAAATSAPAEKPPLTVGMFQKRLSEAGYYDGAWDGDYGPYTKLWVARFQAAHNLPITGEPTTETLVALGL